MSRSNNVFFVFVLSIIAVFLILGHILSNSAQKSREYKRELVLEIEKMRMDVVKEVARECRKRIESELGDEFEQGRLHEKYMQAVSSKEVREYELYIDRVLSGLKYQRINEARKHGHIIAEYDWWNKEASKDSLASYFFAILRIQQDVEIIAKDCWDYKDMEVRDVERIRDEIRLKRKELEEKIKQGLSHPRLTNQSRSASGTAFSFQGHLSPY